MSDLLLIALLVAVVVLWRRVAALTDRLSHLEFAPAPLPEPVVDAVAVRAIEDGVVATAPVREPSVWRAPPSGSLLETLIREPARNEPVASLATVDPVPAVEPAPAAARFNFEELFGRRLPVWAGGVTLAVAGFLIVKYSIDAGLLSPAIRVLFGLVFGTALIGGAEFALRRAGQVRDPRVAQALSGAGVATLYACVLVASNLYGLVGASAAFVGMAAVTALAGGLALRFGAPSALLGLVGGLAAPALVGAGEPNVPLLSAYLSLAVGGLCTLSRSRGWMWLGAAALAGGFGWGLVLILGGALDLTSSLSVGAFTLLLGVGLPVLVFGGERASLLRLAAGLAGCAQMAALVATGGFAPLNWALFGLLSIAAVWLARREAALRPLAPAALTVALLLLAAWPDPTPTLLAAVLVGVALIQGGSAAWDLWRERGTSTNAWRIAAVAVAVPALPLLHLDTVPGTFALLALLGAAPVAALALLGWSNTTRPDDARFTILVGTTAALLIAAGVAVAPDWLDAPAAAVVTAALLLLSNRADDLRLERAARAFGVATIVWLIGDGMAGADFDRAFGDVRPPAPLRVVTWAIPALVAALFAWRARIDRAVPFAQAFAVVLAYAAAAQVTPAHLLPIVPALLLAAAAWRDGTTPARATAAALAAAWAAEPLLTWLTAAGGAVIGEPLFVQWLPTPIDALLRLALPAAALVVATRDLPAFRRPARLVAATIGVIVAHILFKQLFAIRSDALFETVGMAERTVWQATLAGIAVALHRRAPRFARLIGAASLAHFAWFTLVLHNPLWTWQAMGAWPLVNLLLPAYGVAFLLLLAAGRETLPPLPERARQGAIMTVLLLFAVSTVRQLAQGSILVGGEVGDAEDIAYSLLGIAAALAYLRHGIATGLRDWRIASLLLMLAAVAKVFLFDAAGLDGLARIAAFGGLGFSLIGIGWLYSRFLPETLRQPVAAITSVQENIDVRA